MSVKESLNRKPVRYPENLLPRDGGAYHWPNAINEEEAQNLFQSLLEEITWRHDEVMMFGKRILMRREMAWYGDEGLEYSYSKILRKAQPWAKTLLKIKSIAEDYAGHTFNSCLLNMYHDGSHGMGWHSDNEKMLNPEASIASISLGIERKFSFKHKTSGEKVERYLGNGSILLMTPPCQKFWQHSLSKSKLVRDARINLTFRSVLKI